MKKQINRSIYLVLFILILIIFSSFIFTKNQTTDIEKKIFNIVNNENVESNNIYKNFIYYKPEGFIVENLDSQVKLRNNLADILIHFGNNKNLQDKFYLNMNLDKTKKLEYIDNKDQYLITWQYNEDYTLALLGHDDRYIEALIPTKSEDYYLILIAQIFTSIKEV